MKIRRVLAGLGASVLALGMGPAMASGNSYTVAVGGSSSAGQKALTASTDASITYETEKPDGTFLRLNCASMYVPPGSGSVVNTGSGVVDIAALKGVSLTNCVSFGGSLTVSTSGTWFLHATSATTPAPTDTVNVHLENISLRFSNGVCQYLVTGGLDGSFNESTQKLTIDEKADGTGQAATVTNVVGCLGQVKNNGRFKFQGTFSTSVAGGSVNLMP